MLMQQKAITEKIIEHYNIISPFYKNLWSEHIHHGYYATGKESKKEATENLIKLIVEKSGLKNNSKVLDVGCGIGGTSVWLANNMNCKVTGITISPVQVTMARKASAKIKNRPKFLAADANNLGFLGKFDAIFAIETVSHYADRENFFRNAANMLNNGGCMIITDWFKAGKLKESEGIRQIEKGMLVSLQTKEEYFKYLKDNGLELEHYEDISQKVKRTWDDAIHITKINSLLQLALRQGREFYSCVKAFQSMKKEYESGSLRYVAIVAKKS